MKAVTTGVNGFIGLQLAERFSAEGWDNVLVLRPGHTMKPPKVRSSAVIHGRIFITE